MIDDDILGKRLFGDLQPRKFWLRYGREVAKPDKDLREALRKQPRRVRFLEIFEIPNDYYVIRDRIGRLSLFESVSRTAYREHLSAWADFARGCWLENPPNRPGVYPTRDKQGCRGRDRELREIDDRLVDVSGGFVPQGKITTWVGSWWSHAMPPLPESL